MALWRDMTAGAVGPGQDDYDPYGDLSDLVKRIAPGIGTAAQASLQPQLQRPDDSFAAYMADPMARSDVDIQQRAAAGPPSASQSLADLGSLTLPYLTGGGAAGTLSTGAKGSSAGAASVADIAARVARDNPAFGSSPYTGAKFPQYAEGYPVNAEPTPTLDPKKGTTFPAKTLTPEGEAFAAERQRIMADMAKNPWTPYYDPAQRFHVDPTDYPTRDVDTFAITPAKQETIDRHMANIGSDQARANLQAGYQRGSEMPDTSNWYAMGQLEQDYIAKLGPEAGRKAFQDRFATGMAATTSGAAPSSNYLASAYLNHLRDQGLPYPAEAYEVPYPIGGGKYGIMPNLRAHQKLFDAGGASALGADNPKRYDFARSFIGDLTHPVMDEQMVSAMTPGISAPGQQYGLYARTLAEEAAKTNVDLPGNYQDIAWAGLKNLKDPKAYPAGKPMIQDINESIERTHRLTGMPRDEIVRRGVVGGSIPLYGLLGAAGLGAASNQ